MRTATVDLDTPDGVADSYLAQPDDGSHPAVLFAMDAGGLRPRIAEMVDRIAARGYVVLAPNLFYRAGRTPVIALPDVSDPDSWGRFMEQVRPLMEQLTQDAMARDGGAYLDYLAAMTPGPVAITGYCMGGRMGWRIAAAHPERVAALAAFHAGGLVTERPDSPHLLADRLRAEVYFGHADQDRTMTPEQIAALDQALDDAGIRRRTEVYAGARHGYTMSDTPVYDEEACQRHFAALFDLLERTLAAG
jgi:carboxymethylenebutenolidase